MKAIRDRRKSLKRSPVQRRLLPRGHRKVVDEKHDGKHADRTHRVEKRGLGEGTYLAGGHTVELHRTASAAGNKDPGIVS